jgi:hypothetical protein
LDSYFGEFRLSHANPVYAELAAMPNLAPAAVVDRATGQIMYVRFHGGVGRSGSGRQGHPLPGSFSFSGLVAGSKAGERFLLSAAETVPAPRPDQTFAAGRPPSNMEEVK